MKLRRKTKEKIKKITAVCMTVILALTPPIAIAKPVNAGTNTFRAALISEPIQQIESEIIEEAPIIEEPVVIEEDVEEPAEEPTEEVTYGVSREEIELLALVTMAEAEGESELGKRLVIDTILNRVDSKRFHNTITEVIYAPGQFSSMWNGRVDRCYVREDIRQLVIEELQNRTNDEVLYFRADYYGPWGTPTLNEGNHYFSK